MVRIIAITLGLLVVSGCSPIPLLKENLKASSPCCSGYQEIRYERYPKNDDVDFEISESSQVYKFETGNSYIKAFDFRDGDKPSVLELKLYSRESSRFDDGVFCPIVKYLDSEFAQVPSDPLSIKYVPPGWTTWGHWKVEQNIPEVASYLILHTSMQLPKERLETGSDLLMIPTSGGSFIPIVLPGGVPCSPTGKLTILGSPGKGQ